MTRVTGPMSKLARGLASSPSVPRPRFASSSASKAAASLAHSEHHAEGRSSESVDTSRRSIMTTHRPSAVAPSRTRTVPLMQTFAMRTSAPQAAQLDTSFIDFAVLPEELLYSGREDTSSLPPLRVPFLPDNFSPDRSLLAGGHAPETPDGPVAAPEIVVVAAHPDAVLPVSALTEVEGMGLDGVELKFAHDLAQEGARVEEAERGETGMLRDLWKGLVDDVFGSSSGSSSGGKKLA